MFGAYKRVAECRSVKISMSVEDRTVSFSLEINVGPAEDEVRRLLTVFNRTISLAGRMFGTENIPAGIKLMQQAIIVANQLRLAYRALQLARMAAGDPLAWALAGISVAEVTVSIYEVTGR